ncbi:hypothetical protein HJ179_11005 [Vibrio parahaemolyticus]|nr:hypothetical protein [Vibrio parahaemolyticus]
MAIYFNGVEIGTLKLNDVNIDEVYLDGEKVARKPMITTQPVGGTITDIQTYTLSVVADGLGSTLSYQWYNGSDPISGATGSSYVFTPSSTGNHTFFCRVFGFGGYTDTSTVTVVVNESMPSSIEISPSAGANVVLSTLIDSALSGWSFDHTSYTGTVIVNMPSGDFTSSDISIPALRVGAGTNTSIAFQVNGTSWRAIGAKGLKGSTGANGKGGNGGKGGEPNTTGQQPTAGEQGGDGEKGGKGGQGGTGFKLDGCTFPDISAFCIAGQGGDGGDGGIGGGGGGGQNKGSFMPGGGGGGGGAGIPAGIGGAGADGYAGMAASGQDGTETTGGAGGTNEATVTGGKGGDLGEAGEAGLGNEGKAGGAAGATGQTGDVGDSGLAVDPS